MEEKQQANSVELKGQINRGFENEQTSNRARKDQRNFKAEEKEEKNGKQRRKFSKEFKYNVVKTVSLVALWIVVGSLNSIVGTTMVDFDELLHTTFDRIGIVMVFRGALSLLGSIIASFFRDKVGVKSELILAFGSAVISVADFLKPWSPSIAFFGVVNAVEGLCLGCMNTTANAMLLGMWGKKAAAPVHAFHFGYGLGALLGPLIAKDFLSVRCPKEKNETVSSTQLEYINITQVCANSTKENPVILVPSDLKIPFSIIAAFVAVLSCTFFIYYLLEKCSGRFGKSSFVITNGDFDKQPAKEEEEQAKQEPLNFFLPFTIGLFILYFSINSFEGVVYSYLFTFAFESGFEKPEAAVLQSAYWGCYTASRFCALVIAHFVSVKIMIFVEMIATLGSLVGLFLLGFQSKTGMWAFACLLGVFVAPIWPSGIAWADRYVLVKAYVVSVTDVGSGISGSIFSYLAGYLVSVGLSRSYLYLAISGGVVAILVLTVLQIMGHRHGDRHLRASSVKS